MMGFLHPKRGFRIKSENEGYFGAHLVWAVQSPETPSILFMVTIRASKPSQGFFSVPWGKIDHFSKKEKALPEPSCSRVFVLRSNIIWGPGFWNLAFFYENPGSTLNSRCGMYEKDLVKQYSRKLNLSFSVSEKSARTRGSIRGARCAWSRSRIHGEYPGPRQLLLQRSPVAKIPPFR